MTDEEKPPAPPTTYGYCCVCAKPCVSGQDLIAGDPNCQLRHKECVPPKKRVEERWG